jgi:predicted phage terminase large subunit-like protein
MMGSADRKLASFLGYSRDLALRESRQACEASLAEFVRQAWHVVEPAARKPLIWNWHLDVLCAYLEAFYDRRVQYLILNVPPGSMKSLLVSVMGPAWQWARSETPSDRFINITNELGLARRDTRKHRDIIQSDWFVERWGGKVKISIDQDTTTHFETTAKGFRQGLGIRGGITGKRGNFLLIDDPVDAERAFSDPDIDQANQKFDQVIGSRLDDLDRDGICIIMQRLRTNDLTGHVLGEKHTTWIHVRIPMEYEGTPGYDPVKDLGQEFAHLTDPRTKVGELMFPARFTADAVSKLKERLGEYGTAGQLQQRPSPLAGGIIRTAWWRIWPDGKKLPKILHAFASHDTAFSEADMKNSAYSACLVFGVWLDAQDCSDEHPEGRHKLMLLSAWWDRVDIDGLFTQAQTIEKKKLTHAADAHLIENKASGISLVQMMRRRSKVRVLTFDPANDGGGDKIARAYLAAPSFRAGLVYAPNRPWAEQVIRLIGEFPACDALGKDLTDCCTQAERYLSKGWWIRHPDDDKVSQTQQREEAASDMFDRMQDDDDMPDRAGGMRGYG